MQVPQQLLPLWSAKAGDVTARLGSQLLPMVLGEVLLASVLRTSRLWQLCEAQHKEGRTKDPMAPAPWVGRKAMRAIRAVRTLQEGCQCSG